MLVSVCVSLFLCLFVVIGVTCVSVPTVEVSALQDLYVSTNGANWNWSPSDVHWNFTGSPDPCGEHWYGVFCSDVSGQSHVSELYLEDFHLRGVLPDSLASLTYLVRLIMFSNDLNGTIPASLGNLSSLEYLYLYDNSLSGSIPPELGNLTSLLKLDLDTNALKSSIPPTLGNLTTLQLLDLDSNALTGSIPPELGQLSNLQVLYLYINAVTGTIPSALVGLVSLLKLALFDNHLNGTIPTYLSALPFLQFIRVDENHLTGTIPANLGNIVGLYFLDVGGNKLNGTIPTSFGNLIAMQTLYLGENALTGTIPASIGHLSAVTLFFVTSNQLSGPIPPGLGNLTTLQELDLHYNALTGTVPNTLQRLVNLTHIDISFNKLSGTIPAGFAEFTLLQQIGMDDNSFTGTLTLLDGDQTALQLIQFENNQLTGTIPNSYAQLAAAENLMLSNNYFTGTLPPGLAKLRQLQGVYVNNNLFTGCLPAFGQLPALQVLGFSVNLFGCTLEGVFNSTVQTQLVEVGLEHNAFTGSLPVQLFRLPALSTLVALDNCLTGTLPDDVCGQVHLLSLILDGLHASSACHSRISALSHSYTVSNGFHGSIPPCLFSLPTLFSLHLSGNSLTGTVPNVAALGSAFLELTLSHNALTGTVPAVVQAHPWGLLDLSYNLLSGTLASTFGEALQPNATAAVVVPHTVYLQNNRLSGRIPSALAHLQNVSMLGSNMFSCDADRSEVPQHDSDRANYECGSDSFNSPFYALLAVGVVTVVVLCSAHYSSPKHSAWLTRICEYYREWMVPVDTLPRSCQLILIAAVILCRVGACCAVVIVVVLVPWYIAASHSYGTYTHQYAWAVSAAFLSGLTPGLTEYFLFTLLVVAVTLRALVLSATLEKGAETVSSLPTGGVNATGLVSGSVRATVYAMFLAVNLTVVIGVNVAFVVVSLTQSHAVLSLFQVLLSIFKLFWNAVCVPKLIDLANMYVGQQDLSATFFAVQAFVGLFNNIAIPCLVVAVLSPSCFYSVFDTPPTVTSNYVAQAWNFQGDSGTSTFYPVLAISEYDPPFSYDYQCSSSFVTYYAPTFVYMAITAAVVMPLANALMVYAHRAVKASSYAHILLEAILPRLLKPIKASSAGDPQKPYFKGSKLLISLIIYLGILLTFGVVFPPLAVAMCVTMLSVAAQAHLSLGRLLHNAREVGALQVVEDIVRRECESTASVAKLQCGFAMVVFFACAFYTLFLFDTLGNALGLSGAYWVLIVMPCTPLFLLAGLYVSGALPAQAQLGRKEEGGDQAVEFTERKTLDADNVVKTVVDGAPPVDNRGTVNVLHEISAV